MDERPSERTGGRFVVRGSGDCKAWISEMEMAKLYGQQSPVSSSCSLGKLWFWSVQKREGEREVLE